MAGNLEANVQSAIGLCSCSTSGKNAFSEADSRIASADAYSDSRHQHLRLSKDVDWSFASSRGRDCEFITLKTPSPDPCKNTTTGYTSLPVRVQLAGRKSWYGSGQEPSSSSDRLQAEPELPNGGMFTRTPGIAAALIGGSGLLSAVMPRGDRGC